MQEITIERAATLKAKPADSSKLGFGNIFTDHMFLMNYDEGEGWITRASSPMAPCPWIRPPCACITARRFSRA